jgi:hypothetical protein
MICAKCQRPIPVAFDPVHLLALARGYGCVYCDCSPPPSPKVVEIKASSAVPPGAALLVGRNVVVLWNVGADDSTD